MSEIKVNKISPSTGTDLDLGDSGDSLKVPSGGFLKVNNIDVVAVAPSTSGNVLTSNGSAWASAAAGGGAWTLLGSINASSTAIAEFTGIDATYNTLVLVVSEVTCANDNKTLRLWLGDNSSYPSAASKSCIHRYGIGEPTPNYDHNGAGAADHFGLNNDGFGNATGESVSGVWYINGTSSSSAYPTVFGDCVFIEDGSGQGRKCSMIGQMVNSLQITKLKVFIINESILTGRISLFGIKHT